VTLRDPEVIETLRDEPELLALADAFAGTQRPQRRRARRLAPRVAAVAAAAAAIAAVVLLWPSGGGNNRILGRALAAIGDGPVLHLLMQVPTGSVLVNLDSGKRVVEKMQIESWSDRDFERAHLVMRFDGRAGDLLLPEDGSKPGATVGPVDPAYAAFWTGYREALANGDAKLEGQDTVDGHAVYWLGFASFEPGRPGTEVAIDRETYKPVVIRNSAPGGRYADMRVLVAETIPYRASDFKRVGVNLFEGSGSSSSGGGSASIPGQQPSTTVTAPWLTAGKRVAGLALASVSPSTTTTDDKTIDGLTLVYGQGRGVFPEPGPNVLSIEELSRPDDPLEWKGIPPGWISVQEGFGGSGPGSMHPTWTGTLAKHGIYVTISTGAGEDAVLEAARGLHPAG
jgi:hypothetical protein